MDSRRSTVWRSHSFVRTSPLAHARHRPSLRPATRHRTRTRSMPRRRSGAGSGWRKAATVSGGVEYLKAGSCWSWTGPLAGNFVKYKQPLAGQKSSRIYTSFRKDVLIAIFSDVRQRTLQTFSRRPLGLRLWLADVAAGVRVPRTGSGAAERRAPRAMRLF